MTRRIRNSDEWQAASLPRRQAGGKRVRLLSVLLLVTCHLSLTTSAQAATKLFLGAANPSIRFLWPSSGWGPWNLRTTQGSAKSTSTMNSISGPITGQYYPDGNVFGTGGTKRLWVSPPLSSGLTLSGTITPNIWGLESNVACNCGFRYEVLRWSVAEGGIVSSLGLSTDNGVTEWGTAAAVRTGPTLTPASTPFAAGDRIILVIYNDDGNGVTEASGRTWTLDFDAGAGVDGDSYLSFTETISFSSDSNNARPIPAFAGMTAIPAQAGIARLLRPLLSWWADFWDEALV